MIDKDSLRKELRKRLASVSTIQRAALSAAIRSKLGAWPAFKSAHAIIGFYPMREEPDIIPCLITQIASGYTVGLVRMPESQDNHLMEVRLWDGSESSLERHSRWPILQAGGRLPLLDADSWRKPREPRALPSRELLAADAGLVLVPALAFTPNGIRLGHGAGWFDAFLKANPGLLRVGIGYGLQLCDSLPQDSWDQSLDYLVTEEGVIDCGA